MRAASNSVHLRKTSMQVLYYKCNPQSHTAVTMDYSQFTVRMLQEVCVGLKWITIKLLWPKILCEWNEMAFCTCV